MGVDYHWFACLVERGDADRFRQEFDRAARAVEIPEQDALDTWGRDTTAADGSTPSAGALYNALVRAFCVESFRPFAAQFCTTSGTFASYLDEATVFRYVILSRCPPAMALSRAVGPAHARQLPGTLGNALLSADDVDEALTSVERAYSSRSTEELVDAAWPLVSHSNERAKLVDIVTLLPMALAEARRRGVGLMTLAWW